ncbi:hypothetical protein PR048_012145 [Dryococelus australis]|uniref:Uncharacterized protein n=1 Tax=Dryococelus australis TaxID=614101 RepID=A0ABQ9HP68_9NEOP|nr:hypothetical protein PR048_012145 [Dryococelus australis]
MEQRRNERAGETGDPPENPLTSGIVRHDSPVRKSGVTRPGIERGLPWWEASRLTAQPPPEAPQGLTFPLGIGQWKLARVSCERMEAFADSRLGVVVVRGDDRLTRRNEKPFGAEEVNATVGVSIVRPSSRDLRETREPGLSSATRRARKQHDWTLPQGTALTVSFLIGPFIVDNRLNGERYIHFLQNMLPEYLGGRSIGNKGWSAIVRGWSPYTFRTSSGTVPTSIKPFLALWIGRGGATAWPPRERCPVLLLAAAAETSPAVAAWPSAVLSDYEHMAIQKRNSQPFPAIRCELPQVRLLRFLIKALAYLALLELRCKVKYPVSKETVNASPMC